MKTSITQNPDRSRWLIGSAAAVIASASSYLCVVNDWIPFFDGFTALMWCFVFAFVAAMCAGAAVVPALQGSLTKASTSVWNFSAPRVILLLRLALVVLGIAYLCFIAWVGVVGWYSRYISESWGICNKANAYTFLDCLRYWYVHWDGRYGFTILTTIAGRLTPGDCRYCTAVSVALSLLGALWAAGTLVRRGYVHPLFLVLFAVLSLTLTLRIFVLYGQTFYFESSDWTYAVAVGMMFCQAALLLRILWPPENRRPAITWLLVGLSGAFTLWIAGFHELYGPLMSIWYVVGLACALISRQRRPIVYALIWCLAASVVGTWLVAHAPGNAVRSAGLPPRPHGLHLLALTDRFYGRFAVGHLYGDSTLLGVFLLIAALCVKPPDRRPKAVDFMPAVVFAIVGAGSIYFCFILSTYATSDYPVPRYVLIPSTILATTVVAIGAVLGRVGKAYYRLLPKVPRIADPILIVLALVQVFPLVMSLPGEMIARYSDLRNAQQEARVWDAQDRYLKSLRGTSSVTVSWDDYHAWNLESDASYWINAEVATYYGIGAIIAVKSAASGAAAGASITPVRK